MMSNGIIVYEGPSALTGAPIVGIVTGLERPSANPKTGDMAQLWILRSDLNPSEAIHTGGDDAICGDCQHRSLQGHVGRSCYVIWWLAPDQVYKAYRQGAYERPALPTAIDDRMAGHYVRLGAYGDPAALPYATVLNVMRCASGSIGYTQQWRTCDPMFSRLCMASVQSTREHEEAVALGWRTFRVRPVGGPVLEREHICPASAEMGHTRTCRDCLLCGGSVVQARSIVIQAHGQRIRWFKEALS